jgi:hypothetical protein
MKGLFISLSKINGKMFDIEFDDVEYVIKGDNVFPVKKDKKLSSKKDVKIDNSKNKDDK